MSLHPPAPRPPPASPPPSATADVLALAREMGMSVTAASVLVRRGWIDGAGAKRFLDPRLSELTSPLGMRDRSEAASRIARAVRSREKICIFGDYDADGITSAALMTDVLRVLGANVVVELANRFDGGYGLSQPAVERVLATGATLLVTCDCGTSDHESLHYAKSRGVDVIVIDHHRVPDEPLPAFAFLNPHRPECAFPFKGMASCGLAFSVCAAVRTELGVVLDLRPWLDLVALGTIADVAPLEGDNRAMVRAGLALLSRPLRAGTRALMEVSKCLLGERITGEDVSFRLAPRINAPGRLGRPDMALELLLAREEPEARALAATVDGLCQERRILDRGILAEAETMLKDPALAALPVIVLGKVGWHQGVVGIVAGRLAATYGKPTIVIGFDGATGRGSVRGPAGFPLYDALARSADALLGFGGHQAAAGVHVALQSLDTLRDSFADACRFFQSAELAQANAATALQVSADATFHESDRLDAVLSDFERFEPCGEGNRAPLVSMMGARVVRAREVTGGHLSLELQYAAQTFSAFGFERGSQAARLMGEVHVVGRLRQDSYRRAQGDRDAVELRIEAVEAIDPSAS